MLQYKKRSRKIANQENNMSTLQIQKCLKDVLALDQENNSYLDWNQGNLKRLFHATSVLYQTSINKVPLRNDEETVRGHICALLACEKLREKQQSIKHNLSKENENNNVEVIQYYLDRIPLEPKKINRLISVFKQNISQCSPVKQIQWSPSPKKSTSRSQLNSPLNSPIKASFIDKGNNGFTTHDPKSLRKMLFEGTPKNLQCDQVSSVNMTVRTPNKNISPLSSPRRRLKFEMVDEDDDENDSNNDKNETTSDHNEHTIGNNEDEIPQDVNILDTKTNDQDAQTDDLSFIDKTFEPNNDKDNKLSKNKVTKKPIIKKNPERTITQNLLFKRYVKVVPSDVISLCNHFELPQSVSFTILDFYMINQSYLIYQWQLVCGLVLHCTFIVFNEKRRKDPRINHILLEKMMDYMRCDSVNDIRECFNIVYELIVGEQWYRDLEIKYNYFEGLKYEESIKIKLGSMLQDNKTLFNDDQYENWKQNILFDLSLKER